MIFLQFTLAINAVAYISIGDYNGRFPNIFIGPIGLSFTATQHDTNI